MFKNTEMLDSVKHRSLKIGAMTDFNFAKQQMFAPISYTEITSAAHEYAIVFPKASPEVPDALPVVLLGLNNANHFVTEQGQWKGRYIPAHFRRYPFILGNTEQSGSFSVMIDSDSPNLSTENGEALFDADGKQTEVLDKIINFLQLFQQEAALTIEFVKSLRAANILIERQIQQQIEGKNQLALVGFEVIDPEKLNAVDDKQFIQWRNQGLLPLIYAHLASLDNIRQLSL